MIITMKIECEKLNNKELQNTLENLRYFKVFK